MIDITIQYDCYWMAHINMKNMIWVTHAAWLGMYQQIVNAINLCCRIYDNSCVKFLSIYLVPI